MCQLHAAKNGKHMRNCIAPHHGWSAFSTAGVAGHPCPAAAAGRRGCAVVRWQGQVDEMRRDGVRVYKLFGWLTSPAFVQCSPTECAAIFAARGQCCCDAHGDVCVSVGQWVTCCINTGPVLSVGCRVGSHAEHAPRP